VHLSIARGLAIALLVGGSIGTAFADTTYQWTLSGGGASGSGLLVTGAADNGGYDVLSFTGSVDGSPVTLYGGQPGPLGASGPGVYYDNILYPGLTSGSSSCAGGHTLVDGCGIAFNLGSGIGNIFDNYSGTGTGSYIYGFSSATINTDDYDATFAIAAYTPPTPTPEPGSVLLLATGLVAMGLLKLKRPGLLLGR
jgi:hypothetical protein